MKRSQINPIPEYFDRYMNLCDDVDVMSALQISLAELEYAPIKEWERIGDKVYAPGKWTIKDLLQHIIDCERVFIYRALAFARGEKSVQPFDEDTYAALAKANERSWNALMEEAITLRRSAIHLFGSFTEEALNRTGEGYKGPYSVRDIGFVLAGHQRWHFNVITERYLTLV